MQRLLWLVCFVIMPLCLPAQPSLPVRGYSVRLFLTNGGKTTGELLAAGTDSLWLLSRNRVLALPLPIIQRVQIPERGLGREKLFFWTVAGGLVSGIALAGACSTVEGCNPGGVFASTLLMWGLVGGVSIALTQPTSISLEPQPIELIRFARFPQGLPPGFRPR